MAWSGSISAETIFALRVYVNFVQRSTPFQRSRRRGTVVEDYFDGDGEG